MTTTDHPFQPGTRVAIRSYAGYREAFVEKVYKNGNFTLRGASKQQWRASSSAGYGDRSIRWTACKTGPYSYDRDIVLLWNEETEREIQEAKSLKNRRDRLHVVQSKVEKLRAEHVSDATLTAFEEVFAMQEAVQS